MYYISIILKSIENVRSLTSKGDTKKVPSNFRNGAVQCGNQFWSTVSVIILLICTGSVRGDIIVTEIMYHPAELVSDSGGEPSEFIELFNPTDQTLDITGYAFDRGITYTFPADSTIQALSYIVIAKDPQLIQNQYGITDVFGPFNGTLSNSGETIRLLDSNVQTVFSLKYGTHGDWPSAPDGTGHSLVFPDLSGDPDRARLARVGHGCHPRGGGWLSAQAGRAGRGAAGCARGAGPAEELGSTGRGGKGRAYLAARALFRRSDEASDHFGWTATGIDVP